MLVCGGNALGCGGYILGLGGYTLGFGGYTHLYYAEYIIYNNQDRINKYVLNSVVVISYLNSKL
jgi:hypothetical protein